MRVERIPPLIVVDTNIIVSAVFGASWPLLGEIASRALVLLPELVFAEAEYRIRRIAVTRGVRITDIGILATIMKTVPTPTDATQIRVAKWLLGRPRESDWPVLATARVYDAHVWTKDRDFSGTGTRTWSNRTIKFLIGEDESGLADNDL